MTLAQNRQRRFWEWSNRRVLRLQAQPASRASRMRDEFPATPRRPYRTRFRFPASASDRIKNKGPHAFAWRPLFLIQWWRRRESNPRPQALYRQFYILSTII